jgi:hypothetical protein
MIKFKEKVAKDLDGITYSIKGLKLEHLQAIMTLVANTRCGSGLYENAVFELCEAFDSQIDNAVAYLEDCVLDVDGDSADDITINLSHFTD